MNPENKQPLSFHSESTERRIIEYPALVNAVQLNVARLLDMQGSLEAKTFNEVLSHYTEEEHERIIVQIGGQFDEALIQFVTGSIIGRRNHTTIILAEQSEGLTGHLPWEPKLSSHIEKLKNKGLLQEVEVAVERYSNDYTDIKSLPTYLQFSGDDSTQQKHAA